MKIPKEGEKFLETAKKLIDVKINCLTDENINCYNCVFFLDGECIKEKLRTVVQRNTEIKTCKECGQDIEAQPRVPRQSRVEVKE